MENAGNVAWSTLGEVALPTQLLHKKLQLLFGGRHQTAKGLDDEHELLRVHITRPQQL